MGRKVLVLVIILIGGIFFAGCTFSINGDQANSNEDQGNNEGTEVPVNGENPIDKKEDSQDIYIVEEDNHQVIYFGDEGDTYTIKPGIRFNSITGKLEYRDDTTDNWVAISLNSDNSEEEEEGVGESEGVTNIENYYLSSVDLSSPEIEDSLTLIDTGSSAYLTVIHEGTSAKFKTNQKDISIASSVKLEKDLTVLGLTKLADAQLNNLKIGDSDPLTVDLKDGDLYVSDDLEVEGTIYGNVSGTISPNFSPGSVVFADDSGNLSEDNQYFYWDDVNNALGVGTDYIFGKLTVNGDIHTWGQGNIYVGSVHEYISDSGFVMNGDELFVNGNAGVGERLYVNDGISTSYNISYFGAIMIGNTTTEQIYDPGFTMSTDDDLYVHGLLGVNGSAYFDGTIWMAGGNFIQPTVVGVNFNQDVTSAGDITAANMYVWDNLMVGSKTEYIGDFDYVMDGDDLYVAGDLGVRRDIYTNGSITISDYYQTISANMNGFQLTNSLYTTVDLNANRYLHISPYRYRVSGTMSGLSIGASIYTSYSINADQNITVGSVNETIDNTSFIVDGDDLFVAGSAGVEGDIYTDGKLYFYDYYEQSYIYKNYTTTGHLTLVSEDGAAASSDFFAYDNLLVGVYALGLESIDDTNFSLDGDDLFVAGSAGIEGDLYVDGTINGSIQTLDLNGGSITNASSYTLNSGPIIGQGANGNIAFTNTTYVNGPTYASTGNVTANSYLGTKTGISISSTGFLFGPNSNRTIVIADSTAPTGAVTDGIQLFAVDEAGSHELRVMDEATNVTTLSPHNFSLIEEGPSEDMAWSHYSERGDIAINADMTKALRLIEAMSGEQLIWMENTATGSEIEYQNEYIKNFDLWMQAVANSEIIDEQEDISGTQIEKDDQKVSSDIDEVVGRIDLIDLLLDKLTSEVDALMQFIRLEDALYFIKNVVFQNEVVFQDGMDINGELKVDGSTAGIVTLTTGLQEVEVSFDTQYSNQPMIQLTPTTKVVGNYWVDSISDTGFVVHLSEVQGSDVRFNWMAVVGSEPLDTNLAVDENVMSDDEKAQENDQSSENIEGESVRDDVDMVDNEID